MRVDSDDSRVAAATGPGEADARFPIGYQIFMLLLSLFAILSIACQGAFRFDSEVVGILQYADLAVCALFFGDFLISLWCAPNRLRYFFRLGWLDLLSSIPTLDLARWGRLARIARIVRVLRIMRSTKLIADLVRGSRGENTVLAALLAALLLILICSISVLQFETAASGNITTAEDALWWAFTTITTVGYGDRYPITAEGRLVATILMVAGVGLFSTLSGLLAAWFLAPRREVSLSEVTALREEIATLRAELRLAAQQRYQSDGGTGRGSM